MLFARTYYFFLSSVQFQSILSKAVNTHLSLLQQTSHTNQLTMAEQLGWQTNNGASEQWGRLWVAFL